MAAFFMHSHRCSDVAVSCVVTVAVLVYMNDSLYPVKLAFFENIDEPLLRLGLQDPY